MTLRGDRPETSARPTLPTGIVTFLFTDIEGSTRLLQTLGSEYASVLLEHRRRLRAAVERAGGVEFGSEGDAVFVAFASPTGAVAASVEAQRSLAEQSWSSGKGLPVRMGIHTGEPGLSAENYVGLDVHRAARIASAAHGGQVLLSAATRVLVEYGLPAGVTLRDLGDHRLKDLARPERLTQLVVEGLQTDFPPPRSLDAIPNNLPVQLTSFVGREELVNEALRLLGRSRLLTLTGPGGTGKTRLALQVAAEASDRYPEGTWFVPLAEIRDPALVLPEIARAMRLTGSGPGASGPSLEDALRGRQILLLLDNLEQVIEAAPIVADLLRRADGITVLSTSRAPLRISGEQELPVPPLALPSRGRPTDVAALTASEAVRLFVERGVAVRPTFTVTEANAAAVAEIVGRLDGLPLALELAAARLRLLAPEQIRDRLDDRLALLSTGARDLPARQQTLRGAIAWSHDLLSLPEQDLFERLAVFSDGWTLDAAASICGAGLEVDVLNGLTALTDQSLVQVVESAGIGGRFAMLESIAAFAAERLAARADRQLLRDRHAAWFRDLAESLGTAAPGPDQGAALDRLEAEHNNLRTALATFAADQDHESRARIVAALWRFWHMRGHLEEGRGLADDALAADSVDHALAPARRRGLLTAAGGIAYWQADFPAVHRAYAEAVEIARATGTPKDIAEALYDLSFAPVADIAAMDAPAVQAKVSPPIIREALAIFRGLGDQEGEARATWALSQYQFLNGEIEASLGSLEASTALFRGLGNPFGLAWALNAMARARIMLKRPAGAAADIREALPFFTARRDLSAIALVAVELSALAVLLGDRRLAYRIAGAHALLAERSGTSFGEPPGYPQLPAHPGDPDGDAAWQEGARMTVEEAIAAVQDAARALAERDSGDALVVA